MWIATTPLAECQI